MELFYLDFMVQGYHEYQAIWSDPYIGEGTGLRARGWELPRSTGCGTQKRNMVTFGLLATCLEEYRPAALFSFGGVVVSSAR